MLLPHAMVVGALAMVFGMAPLLRAPLPCSAFLVVGSGKVLFGNNEDYLDPDTRVWFVPAKAGRRGVMYLGFGNGFPQGGMNDQGLAFDGFATGRKPLVKQGGKKRFAGNPIAEAMETCSTVKEVVAFLRGVDLSPLLTNGMVFFADAGGASVIVEGDQMLAKEGDFQVVTNFYQSDHADDLAQCPRYASIVRMLEARKETSVKLCERALASTAQRGSKVATLYSNVFDLKARTANLYLFHDFEHPVAIDLAAELKKGARTQSLPELFEENAKWRAYVAGREREVAAKVAKRRGKKPSADEVAACVGAYELRVDGQEYSVSVTKRGDGLRIDSEALQATGGGLDLHAESPDTYFALTVTREYVVRFRRERGAKATAVILRTGGRTFRCARVE